MTDSPIELETRLNWFYQQYAHAQTSMGTMALGHIATGSVFSSAIIKMLLSFNGAAILGYPVFLSHLPDVLRTEQVYENLKYAFCFFVASLLSAMFCALAIYFNWLSHAHITNNAGCRQILTLRKDLLNIVDDETTQKELSGLLKGDEKHKKRIIWTYPGAVILGLTSVALMIGGIYTAAKLFQYFPST